LRRLILALTDGLRPDAITPTVMPSLHALAAAYTSAAAARTVRPSATVAALASLATGVAPDTHRLIQPGLDFLPRIRRLRPVARELSRHGIPADVVTAELPLTSLPVAWALASAAGVRRLLPAGRRARRRRRRLARERRPLGSGVLAGPGVAREHRLLGPVSILDLSATVLWWFGAPIPDCYEGRPLLEAFAPQLVAQESVR
jgi:hypothetical protein